MTDHKVNSKCSGLLIIQHLFQIMEGPKLQDMEVLCSELWQESTQMIPGPCLKWNLKNLKGTVWAPWTSISPWNHHWKGSTYCLETGCKDMHTAKCEARCCGKTEHTGNSEKEGLAKQVLQDPPMYKNPPVCQSRYWNITTCTDLSCWQELLLLLSAGSVWSGTQCQLGQDVVTSRVTRKPQHVYRT